MESFNTKIIADGRITVEKTIRKKLGLKEGDLVYVEIKKIEVSKD